MRVQLRKFGGMLEELLSAGAINHKRLLPHKNRGLEIVYVERGYLHWRVENRVEQLGPGSVFFTLPWQAHGSIAERDPPNFIYWVLIRLDRLYEAPVPHFGFPQGLGFSSAEARRISQVLCRADRNAGCGSANIAFLLPSAVKRCENMAGSTDRIAARSLIRALIAELACVVSDFGSAESLPREARSAHLVRKFLAQLSDRCGENWNLASMAAACGLGRTHFSEIVRQITGASPGEMLSRLRIEKARHLLMTTSQSITEVAFQCGFNSSQYFSKVFRRFTDLSPTAFRVVQRRDLNSYNRLWDQVEFRSEEEEKHRIRNRGQMLSW
jgi:AraC family L-rhamnose operon regulatory protein RhaS